ncbi:MAG: DUF4340 domain-containing protein [Chloroflexi bacterium]|nr:DUF4340 domain-containing protein [Chloroflexota bacterium]
MNVRVTFILVVLVVVVGGYVLLFELQRTPPRVPEPPWFYNVEFSDITGITVTYEGTTLSFVQKQDQWVMGEAEQPVDTDRWSGVPFLVAGPRTKRTLAEEVPNLAAYGLDPPRTIIRVSLRDGRQPTIALGDKTADGQSFYGQLQGQTSLYTVDYTWGDVLIRLVTEPPIPAPTPEPTPSPAATPG